MTATETGLQDRVALVTGAASGIGRAIAERFAASGATVAVCDWDAEALGAFATDVARATPVRPYVLDVRDRDAVDEMFSSIGEEFGRLDVLVNNAGGTYATPFEEMSVNGERAVIAENFTSVTHCTRRAIELMRDGGSIVNVTSIEAHRAAPGVAVYAAMNAAVESLTKTLALELAPRRIRVNCLAPDMIDTPGSLVLGESMQAVSEDAWFPQPWPDAGDVQDAADVALFLAGSMSRFVTGSTVHVDGGNWASGGWKLHRRGIYVV